MNKSTIANWEIILATILGRLLMIATVIDMVILQKELLGRDTFSYHLSRTL